MTVRRSLVLLALLALGACGGGTHSTLPDESTDLQSGGQGGGPRERVPTGRAAGPQTIGTRWRYTEAHCTEGTLDLSPRGFAQELRVMALGANLPGFMLVYDQTFAREQCTQTVMISATPSSNGEFQLREEQRISVPATPACENAVRPDPPRPGEVRLVGGDLEVLTQRSNWCGGFEVRMTYQPLPPELLTEEQIIRRYVAYFNRKDVPSIAGLFADTGSLVDPFTVSDIGGATRHEGREAVAAWYAQAFDGVPWVGLKLTGIRHEGDSWTAEWAYMDGRLEEPFTGTSQFTIAAGEIFEAQMALTRPPPGAEGAVPPPATATAGRR
jgi:hypothetical protein